MAGSAHLSEQHGANRGCGLFLRTSDHAPATASEQPDYVRIAAQRFRRTGWFSRIAVAAA